MKKSFLLIFLTSVFICHGQEGQQVSIFSMLNDYETLNNCLEHNVVDPNEWQQTENGLIYPLDCVTDPDIAFLLVASGARVATITQGYGGASFFNILTKAITQGEEYPNFLGVASVASLAFSLRELIFDIGYFKATCQELSAGQVQFLDSLVFQKQNEIQKLEEDPELQAQEWERIKSEKVQLVEESQEQHEDFGQYFVQEVSQIL